MKFLMIMEGFFPGKKYGGPPVSVDNFCTLMKEHECYIVCKNHDMGDSQIYKEIHPGWNKRDNSKIKYFSDDKYNMVEFERTIVEIKPDYSGFTIPNEFVVGFGLDYEENYRNLPYVGVLKPEVYNI